MSKVYLFGHLFGSSGEILGKVDVQLKVTFEFKWVQRQGLKSFFTFTTTIKTKLVQNSTLLSGPVEKNKLIKEAVIVNVYSLGMFTTILGLGTPRDSFTLRRILWTQHFNLFRGVVGP